MARGGGGMSENVQAERRELDVSISFPSIHTTHTRGFVLKIQLVLV